MGFDEKLSELSKTIYQTSVMSHGSKNDPSKQIDKIKDMIKKFIRLEITPYELTDQEKLKFILENELKIIDAISKGHRASDNDEFQKIREKIKQYRKDLNLI